MNDVISRLEGRDDRRRARRSPRCPSFAWRGRGGRFWCRWRRRLAVGVAIVGTVVMTRGALDQTVATTTSPRFIVEARDQSALIVRGVGDGAEIDRVAATAGGGTAQVQAAPDNRTFYATMSGRPIVLRQDRPSSPSDDDGRAGPLTELPIRPPTGNQVQRLHRERRREEGGLRARCRARPRASSAGVVVVADAESGAAQTLSVGPVGRIHVDLDQRGRARRSRTCPWRWAAPSRCSRASVIVPSEAATEVAPVTALWTVSPTAKVVVPVGRRRPGAHDRPSGPEGEGTLQSISSCRFYAPAGRRPDLGRPGVDAGLSRRLRGVRDRRRPARAPRPGGFELTADARTGRRSRSTACRCPPTAPGLIAGVGTGTARLDDPQCRDHGVRRERAARRPGLSIEGRGWLRLLDLAAGGTQMLVQSELEIGVVSGNAYRKVVDIPGRVMDGVVAW